MSNVRMSDVAKAAGVSSTTVSLALSNTDARIPQSTRERVVRVAQELGYVPNAIARSLRTRSTRTIGLLSDRIATTPFAGRMLAGAQEVARENDHLVILVDTDGHPEIEADAIRALGNQQVDGLIYASMWNRVVDVPAGLPDGTVFLDCGPEGGGYAAVIPDDYEGGRSAVLELIARGHRRIAYVDTNEERPVAAELRYRGYLDVLAQASIDPDPALHVFGATSAQGGRDAIAALWRLEAHRRPTAIFTFNDRMAVGVYSGAIRQGIRIPEDLSVVGYDDQQLVASELDPPLTTIALPHAAMGRWAMEVALGIRVVDPEATTHLMPCPVIRRASVGPPPEYLGS